MYVHVRRIGDRRGPNQSWQEPEAVIIVGMKGASSAAGAGDEAAPQPERSMRIRPPLVLVFSMLAACASGGSGGGGNTGAPRASRDLIVLSEIEGVEVTNAFELIQRLRPEMLRARSGGGFTSTPTAVVYLDGVRHGDLSSLNSVPKDIIREVRYINAADATTRFGTGHTGGAILITTRRGNGDDRPA
jgi:hypothetical protein